jgi:hypothetical protein
MKKMVALLLLATVLIGGAYFSGFWPEHQRLTEAQARVQTLEQRLAETEARIRLGEILGQLLALSDAVAAQNFGDASGKASSYFDRVAIEAQAAGNPNVRAVLEEIRDTRDTVTAGLARAEPAVMDTLRHQQLALRRALGYDVSE